MPKETERLKLPLPLGNENVTRESINGIFEKIDAGVATREEVEGLRDLVNEMDIQDASLTVKGIVQLSSATDSSLEERAATPKAVKAAYDEAIAAKQLGVEQKANVVAALNSIGVSASTNESWAQLINMMTGLLRAQGNAAPSDVRAGKRFSNSQQADLVGTLPERTKDLLTIVPGVSTKTNPSGIYGGDIIVQGVTVPAANVLAGTTIAGTAGTMPNRGAGGAIIPSKTTQIKPAGYYNTDIVVPGEPNLRPEIILENNRIYGVDGTYKPTQILKNSLVQYLRGYQVRRSLAWFTLPAGKSLFYAPSATESYISVDTGNGGTGAETRIFIRDQAGKEQPIISVYRSGAYNSATVWIGFIEVNHSTKKLRYSYRNPGDTLFTGTSWLDASGLDWTGPFEIMVQVSNQSYETSQGANTIILSGDAYIVIY